MHLYKPVRKGQESSVYTVFSNQQDQKTKKFQVETAPAPYIESKHYFIHISKEKGLKIAQRLNYATIMYKMTWPVRHRFQIAPFRHQTNCRQPDMRLVDPA